jgi:hypothetical protein
MSATVTKKKFFNQIKDVYKKEGFEFVDGHVPNFILKTDEYVVQSPYTIKNSGEIWAGKFLLCIWQIENLILEIGIPTNDFTEQKKKKTEFLTTVADVKGVISFNMNETIKTDAQIDLYFNAIQHYVEFDGKDFLKKFTYLPNILKEIDLLESEGRYWREFIGGGPEHLFRVLIISKLCNDSNYTKKFSRVSEAFNSGLSAWQPYWQKLLTLLENIEPIYNT